MFGRFSRGSVIYPCPVSVPTRRRRLQPASSGPSAVDPVKPESRERSASASPSPARRLGTCQAPALPPWPPLAAAGGSRLRAPGRARLPRAVRPREPEASGDTAEPRARSAGSWSGTPSAPRAPAPRRVSPPPPPAAGFEARAQAGARDPGTLRARPGPGGGGGAGQPRARKRAARQEELPRQSRGGASGRPRTVRLTGARAAGPHLGRPPPPPPPPARIAGCWWTPGSSGGGGGCLFQPRRRQRLSWPVNADPPPPAAALGLDGARLGELLRLGAGSRPRPCCSPRPSPRPTRRSGLPPGRPGSPCCRCCRCPLRQTTPPPPPPRTATPRSTGR